MLRYYFAKARTTGVKDYQKFQSRLGPHNFRNETGKPNASFDQYAAHSPLQASRYSSDEIRSKIFFQHPPIPNRIPKFVMAFFLAATFSTGFLDKFRRKNKK